MHLPTSRRLPSRLSLLFSGLTLTVLLSACGLFKKKDSVQNTGSYAGYPSDGHYNPYPGGSQATTQYEEYTEAPPPPAPTSGSKKKASTTSSSSGAAAKKSTSSGGSYVVKRGDTLWGIARRNHSTVSKLKSANGLTSDLIRDGQKLRIP